MSAFQMAQARITGRKSNKDKSFSSKGKIEKYNQDGTETIIVMGRPFRVLQNIGASENHISSHKERDYKSAKHLRSFVFLVENTENLSEFPRHFALKRSFFNVNEVLLAHREPEVLARVSDKNIVRVFHTEVTRSDGKLGVTVAMEYCSNNLYRQLRPDTRVPEGEIVQVLLGITSAVGYLHSRQPPIAHRDICPENILIHSGSTGAASYRLCNFSSATTEAYHCANREEVAMAVEDIERNTSPGYRAPEMADPGSGKRIDERVDLWSIGVLLYYMMYLRLPFGETNMGLTGRLKLRFPAGTEMWYTGSLRVVLAHLLEPDPDKRWDIFALTNFLRFDDEIGKHIGTFFFAQTEWPDGWEQQDVKVFNRQVPPKAPPIRVNTPKHAENTKNATDAGTTNRMQASSEMERGSSMGGDVGELDAAALAALGLDGDSKDPEMRKYYKMLIQEQEDAWRMAKSASQASAKNKSGDTTNVNNRQAQETREEKQREEEPPKQRQDNPPNDNTPNLFDDLFSPSPAAQASSGSLQAPSQQTVSRNPVTGGQNWPDSLFSGVQPSQPLPQQQPPLHAQNSYDMMMDSGWGTGAPTMAPGGGAYDVGAMYAGTQMATAPTFSMPPHPTQQHFSSSWGNSAPPGPQATPIQQQQQQQPFNHQTTMDFAQGSLPTAVPAEPKPEAKKDPFADLFL
ncbi:protein kinase [Trypanosoma cruzi Dm28c]|uniref:non-specific serine/threonine protein kinase n=1 Tax=Trypanosoma cruzi Dm28c TaxID=1416333 RepID=V5BK24_TRYCR|nr:protein kinase [Trypanosoma cruzi Dm28c]PBJ79991.1 protein kinase [Trypanosoma cruzi cruzi]